MTHKEAGVLMRTDFDWKKTYYNLAREVDQVLGQALGYPWFKNDQKNFPGTTEADGVCTADHVPESLLAEAAEVIQKSRKYSAIKPCPENE